MGFLIGAYIAVMIIGILVSFVAVDEGNHMLLDLDGFDEWQAFAVSVAFFVLWPIALPVLLLIFTMWGIWLGLGLLARLFRGDLL